MLHLESDPNCFLLSPADLDQDASALIGSESLDALKAIVTWAREFLCNPHPNLGRDGSVCPYVKPSTHKGLFWLTIYRGPHPSMDEVYTVIMKYRDWFLELEPSQGREAQYKTILILFPDITEADAPALIDATQARLKPEFVEKGLMIGQFHGCSEEPGLWNQDFRPLRTPVPLLAIRHMVPSDFPFLDKDSRLTSSYVQIYGDKVPERLKPMVHEAAERYGLEFA